MRMMHWMTWIGCTLLAVACVVEGGTSNGASLVPDLGGPPADTVGPMDGGPTTKEDGGPWPDAGAPDSGQDGGAVDAGDAWVPPDTAPPSDTGPTADGGGPDVVELSETVWPQDVPAPADGVEDTTPTDTYVQEVQPDLPPDIPVQEICPAVAQVHGLDIWARYLPMGQTQWSLSFNGEPLAVTGAGIQTAPLCEAGELELSVQSEGYEPFTATFSFSGGGALGALWLTDGPEDPGHGLLVSHEQRWVGSEPQTAHLIFVGLRHRWFSSQARPPQPGNAVELYLDGEETWSTVRTDLLLAQETIHISTWWWQSDFELVRDWYILPGYSQIERWENTMIATLQSVPAMKRILVGEFWGEHSVMDWITADSLLESYALDPYDSIEFMGQGNATAGQFWFEPDPVIFSDRLAAAHPQTDGLVFDDDPVLSSVVPGHWVDLTDVPAVSVAFQHASWHQKFLVVDHDIAWIGGMNVKGTDWDSNEHRVFEHRRMAFDATGDERLAVFNKEADSDYRPRKDYVLRVAGPAARAASEVFQTRWEMNLASGAPFSEHSSPFLAPEGAAPAQGDSLAQVTATMPEPWWEHGIAETWWNAISEAEDFIFIEDQYWRLPMMADLIIARMQEVPELKLLVVTQTVDEWLDPACETTHAFHHQLLDALGPLRYRTYQLRSFDWVATWGFDETEGYFADLNVHSKLLIVDDVFMSVGSCNKNNRGLIYEGELNAAVLDPVMVREARRRVFANMLPAGTPATDDVDTWWWQFEDAAWWNDLVYEAWDAEGWDIDCGDLSNPSDPGEWPCDGPYMPDGFVYSLDFRTPDYCLLEGVGPDMFFLGPAQE